VKSEPKLVRIVPVSAGDDRPNPTQGTAVYVGDQEITGVTRIELVCEVNNVWRAKIECMVDPPANLLATAIFHRPTIWQRFKRWVRMGFGPAHGFDWPR